MKQAWRTTAAGVTSIVAAETRGKAIAITMRAAREVGYMVAFHEVKASRVPEYNEWARGMVFEVTWREEDIAKSVAACAAKAEGVEHGR
jgi:hypothetical protein